MIAALAQGVSLGLAKAYGSVEFAILHMPVWAGIVICVLFTVAFVTAISTLSKYGTQSRTEKRRTAPIGRLGVSITER